MASVYFSLKPVPEDAVYMCNTIQLNCGWCYFLPPFDDMQSYDDCLEAEGILSELFCIASVLALQWAQLKQFIQLGCAFSLFQIGLVE